MGLYAKYVLPKIVHNLCKQKPAMKQRAKIIPLAFGNVLEIGIGSGLNIPFYNSEQVKGLIGIDPSIEMWKEKDLDEKSLPFEFKFIQAIAENIPIDNNSFDSAVVTYSLCTVNDLTNAFEELKRVLKPNGRLVFCEHGLAPDKLIISCQNLMNPIWKKFGGGCNLNRDIPGLIKSNGFKIEHLESMYIQGWKLDGFNYWGTAIID